MSSTKYCQLRNTLYYLRGSTLKNNDKVVKSELPYELYNKISISEEEPFFSDGQIFYKNAKQHHSSMKIRRYIKRCVPEKTDEEYDLMGSLIESKLRPLDPKEYQIVSGEEIRKYYSLQWGGSSCMTKPENAIQLNHYVFNPDKVRLLVAERNGVKARRLLFTTDDNQIYACSTYTPSTELNTLVAIFCENNQYIMTGCVKVTLIDGGTKYPFLDSLHYGKSVDGLLYLSNTNIEGYPRFDTYHMYQEFKKEWTVD